LFPLAICFIICSLAETNRIPFDLVEAEAELVAGYNVEYGGFFFAMFFLSEYSFILLMCSLFTSFFLAGGDSFYYSPEYNYSNFLSCFIYDSIFSLKAIFISFIFVFIRANLPRYRFDQLLVVG
jgi:NADH-quinone oxidoreductase subunit H